MTQLNQFLLCVIPLKIQYPGKESLISLLYVPGAGQKGHLINLTKALTKGTWREAGHTDARRPLCIGPERLQHRHLLELSHAFLDYGNLRGGLEKVPGNYRTWHYDDRGDHFVSYRNI